MPILPLIDLLILMSSGSLAVACLLKAIALTTAYRPTPGGLTPFDWVVISLLLLAFALALAARTWVKLNEPRLLRLRGRDSRFGEDDFGPIERPEPLASLPKEMVGGERR